jgi:hypothetical protein
VPVGSSASSSCGLLASARAMATRCCSPPDSSAGRCSRAQPPRSKQFSRLAAASARARPAIICGTAMFSSAENSRSRWWRW